MRKGILVLFILTIFCGSLFAQEVKFDAQIRYRSEFDKNGGSFNNANFQNAKAGNNFELLRTRFGAYMDSGNDITAYIQIQDARKFGEEYFTTEGKADMFDLHQGYIYIKNMFDKELNLSIGRMELGLGNQRLVGTVGWINTGRSFDGALVSKHTDKYEMKFFHTKVNEAAPVEDFDPDEYFSGLFYTYKQSEIRNINLFGFLNFNNNRIPDEDKRYLTRITAGFDYTANHDNFDYEVEGAYQLGKEYVSAVVKQLDVGAYMFAAKGHYKFDHEKKPYIGIGFDYLSGDDDPIDDDLKSFNTLYATNHKYYGYMDYFTSITAATFGNGLSDIFLTGGLTFSDNASLKADWHYFNYAVKDAYEDKNLGMEFDLTYKYYYRETVNFQLGGSVFLPGDVPKRIEKNDKPGFWTYVMMTYNFKQN
ncbi:MAG: alginate export family protein [bacterium]|nr:alginate export family protein [bacterium]